MFKNSTSWCQRLSFKRQLTGSEWSLGIAVCTLDVSVDMSFYCLWDLPPVVTRILKRADILTPSLSTPLSLLPLRRNPTVQYSEVGVKRGWDIIGWHLRALNLEPRMKWQQFCRPSKQMPAFRMHLDDNIVGIVVSHHYIIASSWLYNCLDYCNSPNIDLPSSYQGILRENCPAKETLIWLNVDTYCNLLNRDLFMTWHDDYMTYRDTVCLVCLNSLQMSRIKWFLIGKRPQKL